METTARPGQALWLARPAAADALRALACGTVAWYHLWQQTWVSAGKLDFWVRSGSVWVDALVLLSAFCLFLPGANARAEGGTPPPTAPLAFYRRRAVRILPGYYVSLLASFAIALAKYGWSKTLGLDLLAHLTFTQMFFPLSYQYSHLNGVTWTLTVFALFYLIFPFLERAFYRWPLAVLAALFGVQWAYTAWLLPQYGQAQYGRLFNQFPAFCGVLAAGMAAACAFAFLGRAPVLQSRTAKASCTGLGLAAFWGVARLLRAQAGAQEFTQFQLQSRMPLAALTAAALVCLALGLQPPALLRRALAWAASISFNLYLWHQMLCLWFKYDLRLPAWQGDTPPNQLGDTVWMGRANLLYWAAALGAAMFFTFAVEKPLARRLAAKPARQAEQGGKKETAHAAR